VDSGAVVQLGAGGFQCKNQIGAIAGDIFHPLIALDDRGGNLSVSLFDHGIGGIKIGAKALDLGKCIVALLD
jgi:hypothetical protein